MTNNEFWSQMADKWQEIETLKKEYNSLGEEYAKSCTKPDLMGKKVRVGRLGVEGFYAGYEFSCGTIFLRLHRTLANGTASKSFGRYPTADPETDNITEI